MQFELSGEKDIYLDIAERYRRYIECGILKEGERLPSVRQTALEIGVNPNTVQRAYTMLESEGYIRTFPKKGVYVKRCEPETHDVPDFRKLLQTMKDSGIGKEELLLQIEEVFSDD